MDASTRPNRQRPSLAMMVMIGFTAMIGASGFAPPPSAALVRAAGASPSRGGGLSMSQAATADTETTMRSSGRRGKREKVRKVWRRSSLHANEMKDKWGSGVWEKFKVPPDGRAHDEVTFRSGCEGRTLTIPQGVCLCLLLLSGVEVFVLRLPDGLASTQRATAGTLARSRAGPLPFVAARQDPGPLLTVVGIHLCF